MKKELLEILCCPKCKGNLNFDDKKNTLTCIQCGKTYEVKDGIPIMLEQSDAQ